MILSEEELKKVHRADIYLDWYEFARAIESAILDKLKAQEPVCSQYQDREGNWKPFINADHEHATRDSMAWPVRDLYTHPLPPADVVRDAERYKWLRKVAPNMFWDNHDKEIGFVRFDTKAYLWKPEMFDAAIDAALGEEK